MTSHSDGHLYLFGNSGSSEVKLAKVRWELAADTSQVIFDRGPVGVEEQAQDDADRFSTNISQTSPTRAGPLTPPKRHLSSRLWVAPASPQARSSGRPSTKHGSWCQ